MKLFELGEKNFNEKQPRNVDAKIIRGGRPLNQKAIEQLKDMGVKTVVCLLKPARVYPAEINGVGDEKPAVQAAGMDFINIPMEESKGPTKQDIEEFLNIARKADGPIYLHCSAGRDRAGLLTAIYDVEIRKHSYEKAYENYLKGGHDYLNWPNLDRFFYKWYDMKHGKPSNPLPILKKLKVKHAEDLAEFITK